MDDGKCRKQHGKDILHQKEGGRSLNIIDDLPAVATGIKTINVHINTDDIFSISGLRMSKPVKGLNIVNGKKVLVK